MCRGSRDHLTATCLIAVTAGCGDTFSQNNTFFDSSSPTDGGCAAKVCACNNNICQVLPITNAIFDQCHKTASIFPDPIGMIWDIRVNDLRYM